MPHIQTDNQPVTQITVIEPEPGKQAEALSLMTERVRFMAIPSAYIAASTAVASSTTSSGRAAISCGRLINRRNSAGSGTTSIN